MSESEQLIHDIRSPLSAIRGYAQLVQRRVAKERITALGVEEGLRLIMESAERVADLLDQLAASSTPESRGALNREPADLVQLAREVAAESQAAAFSRGAVVVLASVPALVGSWDVGRLTRVLANVIGNALKYNCENRPVLVTVRRAGGMALLTVTDQGLGIPAADLPHVFERGYRGRNVAKVIDGSGLGLAGAQAAVTEHGGVMQVESQEAVGTTVTVQLPLRDSAADSAVLVDATGAAIQ